MRKATVEIGSDTETSLRSALCIYLIAECRAGATVSQLADLRLGGNSPAEEVARVSEAVSQLVHEGEVSKEGPKVVPIDLDQAAMQV